MRSWLAVLLIVLGFCSTAEAAERRVALLIGNQDYPASVGRLVNTHADVSRMAEALNVVGFEVSSALDADDDAMETALQDFEARISSLTEAGDQVIAFFYYSGHGASMSVDGETQNFLIPAKEDIPNAGALERKGMKVNSLLRGFSLTDAHAFFVLLDACRDEMSTGFTKSANKGATRVEQRRGMWVAYATSPGATTPDDGLFSTIVAEEILKPGKLAEYSLLDAVKKIAVQRSFSGQPIMAPGLLPDGICFAGCRKSEEEVVWEGALKHGTFEGFKFYLDLYSNGRFAIQARDRLSRLTSLREEQDWTRLSALNSVGGFMLYIEQYPSGSYVAEARAKIVDLQETKPAMVSAANPDRWRPWNQIEDDVWYSANSLDLYQSVLKEVSFEYLQEAADGGDPRAARLVGWAFMDSSSERQTDYPMAFRYLTQACDEHEPGGCVNLGNLYYDGRGVTEDRSKTFEYYEIACRMGNFIGCGNLGLAYFYGWGVEPDVKTAGQYFVQACDGGYLRACADLDSVYHRNASWVDINYLNEKLELSCEAGDVGSCVNVGNHYRDGMGGQRNDQRAVELYKLGCTDEKTNGCTNLAYMYQTGRGVEPDLEEAFRIYLMACENNNWGACYSVSNYYQTGTGVERNERKAREIIDFSCDGLDDETCVSAADSLWHSSRQFTLKQAATEILQDLCKRDVTSACGHLKNHGTPI
ncbi:MAG: hypothetical protein CMK09_10460 [Ponticaulis sp.]|nr:hypothetical protein [Ponticaulis sp.]|tara:strand:+ start:22578 stop:24680 length:2103 start_codon:yes stop_codon:yes gene_type:complete